MRKHLCFLLVLCMILFLFGCSGDEEITLNLTFGDRTGTYVGEVNGDGIPHGQGKFTSTNAEGEKWTYEGEFVNGHFEGEGKTTWESGTIEIGTYKNDEIVPLKGNEIKSLYTSPEEYLNHYVELTGVVFAAPEYTSEGVAIQMSTDMENYENDVIVVIYDSDFEVNEYDYVNVVGKVGEVFVGENIFGQELSLPTIYAEKYGIIDYKDAMAPTINEIEVNQSKSQFGYGITIQKVEFAEKETRVYVKVDNNGKDKFTVYSFNSHVVQAGKQYNEQDNWDSDYPEIQTDLLVGSSSEGVIVFPALKQENFRVILEGQTENWYEDLVPYEFEIKI